MSWLLKAKCFLVVGSTLSFISFLFIVQCIITSERMWFRLQVKRWYYTTREHSNLNFVFLISKDCISTNRLNLGQKIVFSGFVMTLCSSKCYVLSLAGKDSQSQAPHLSWPSLHPLNSSQKEDRADFSHLWSGKRMSSVLFRCRFSCLGKLSTYLYTFATLFGLQL